MSYGFHNYDGPVPNERFVNIWEKGKKLDKYNRELLLTKYKGWIAENNAVVTLSRASGYNGMSGEEVVGIYFESSEAQVAFRLTFSL